MILLQHNKMTDVEIKNNYLDQTGIRNVFHCNGAPDGAMGRATPFANAPVVSGNVNLLTGSTLRVTWLTYQAGGCLRH